MTEDETFMSYALSLAKKGIGSVNPNPLVGAVIVKKDVVIGQGGHETFGGYHAEINALSSCSTSPVGATMYVTLEPCCHYGKTPPCTEAIISSGISRIVIGCLDPNPLMSGKGVTILQKAGIKVVFNILREECQRLNEIFFHFIQTKTPYVVMKYAMTMDGKIATITGDSKWITNEISRINVHNDRNRYSAIMVGVGTIIADNPSLMCRIDGARNPVRIICDTHLSTPLDSIVVTTAKEAKTILATACINEEKHKPYLTLGCNILVLNQKENHIDLNHLMIELGKCNIDSILLEGGSTLNFSFLQNGIVNKIQAYIAPKLLGGEHAKTPIGGIGIPKISNCIALKNQHITWYGNDLLIESEVDYSCSQV